VTRRARLVLYSVQNRVAHLLIGLLDCTDMFTALAIEWINLSRPVITCQHGVLTRSQFSEIPKTLQAPLWFSHPLTVCMIGEADTLARRWPLAGAVLAVNS